MSDEMEYRRLGRTELQVSAVGIGTCQMQVVPEKQAIETLLRGFDLGVNLVHTAPEYGRADEYVAAALARTDRHIIVAAQGFDVPLNRTGPVKRFEEQFETSSKRFGRGRLDLFGIGCIDDREEYGENVWGKDGMVEFLLRKKEQGRLGSIFCTTHGAPEYIERLVRCGVFDAVMVAYNALGFHLLTSNPPPERHFESLPRTGAEIIPLCQQLDVGVMVMKPLGGGLLCRSRALPPLRKALEGHARATAGEVLRGLLEDRRLACVVPGTAHPAEAEENARSGHKKMEARRKGDVEFLIDEVRRTVCSRCGGCESSCSRELPVATIMRSALVNQFPSARHELHKEIEYFEVHPNLDLACGTCTEVTCQCPAGIDIPRELNALHGEMRELLREGMIPPPVARQDRVFGSAAFAAKVLSWDIPAAMEHGETASGNILLENAGERGWFLPGSPHAAEVVLALFADGRRSATVKLAGDVQPLCRGRFVFEVTAPLATAATEMQLKLQLLGEHEGFSVDRGIVVFSGRVALRPGSQGRARRNAVMEEQLLTRAARPYGCEWLEVEAPPLAKPGGTAKLRIRAANRGTRPWRAGDGGGHPTDLVVRIGGTIQQAVRVARDVAPGQANTFSLEVRLPADGGAGACRVELGLVEQNVAWFEHHGVEPLKLDIRLEGGTAYGVEWLGHNLPRSWPAGSVFQAHVHVRNTGARPWRPAAVPGAGPVDLALFLDGKQHVMARVPREVAPGEEVLLSFRLSLPEGEGERSLRLTFVEQGLAWFDQSGAQPLTASVRVGPRDTGPLQEAMAASMQTNWAFWLPAECVTRSRTGRAYPSFIRSARGCRIRDVEDNEWIDMAMSGGSAILGYANAEIREAIAEALDSSAVITLPHILEIEVSQMLNRLIPSAEMVLFGKHGSDACTAAVRIARLHTGRRKVLFSGYHGWHDWYAEALQPALRPAGEPTSLFRFFLNDLPAFEKLVEAHRGEVAAVMLEPAAQAESVDGPIRDVDPAFLRGVAEVCRREGIVLVFDEIITGFRYRQGSVQKAHGVVPDLTCLGKALSAGMPLSALVGKRQVMAEALSNAYYYPTFRGEVYSLAAAKAALRIHARDDVPALVERFGKQLAEGINAISRELGVAGKIVGMGFRMIYCFDEPDYLRRRLKRTLLLQELLQRGVLSFLGYMLPSTAHGGAELDLILTAFRGALEQVEMAAAARSFAPFLEIPLMG